MKLYDDPSTEATPHAVWERLGDPVRYYATATDYNPVPWDRLGERWPDCGFGEARAPDDWFELHAGESARVLSVTPEAMRWTTERAEPHIRFVHAELFCAGDPGDQVRTGWVTRVGDNTLKVDGTMSASEGGWESKFE